jgi:hypothetical protein
MGVGPGRMGVGMPPCIAPYACLPFVSGYIYTHITYVSAVILNTDMRSLTLLGEIGLLVRSVSHSLFASVFRVCVCFFFSGDHSYCEVLLCPNNPPCPNFSEPSWFG